MKQNGSRKTATKTALPAKRVPSHGNGQLLTGGVPGNKGGRPPNWLREWCDDLLASETTKEQVRQILEDRTHAAFAAMWRAVGDRGHGRPAQNVVLSGDNANPLRIVVVRE